MKLTSGFLGFVALVSAASCKSDVSVEPVLNPGQVRAINASAVPVNVTIDGQVVLSALPVATISSALNLAPGTHTIGYATASGGTVVTKTVSIQTAQQIATFAFSPSAASLGVDVIADTGAIVPPDKSKLRVSNLAPSLGTNEIRRTQPDYQTPITIQTPFPYQATSPYLQSDPGAWEVMVTPAGGGAKIATTGPVNIPAGQRRTVVLLDSAGTLVFKVFE